MNAAARVRAILVAVAAAVFTAGAAVGSVTPWPAVVILLEDSAITTIETGFSAHAILDCPAAPAALTAYEAGPGMLVIARDPAVGPPVAVRYAARYWTDRHWPALVPALLLAAPVTEHGASLDGGFAGDFEDCVTYQR